ncbi:MAG: LPXTG cell wall anchor domain-containing protein, partial [Parasporobacterium sp.]|nr:LPXTG cell wall anchor domain-containing protein [Parasporobacterium sp.]
SVENTSIEGCTVKLGSADTKDIAIHKLSLTQCTTAITGEDVDAENLTITNCSSTLIQGLGHTADEGGITLGKVDIYTDPAAVSIFTAEAGTAAKAVDIIYNGNITAQNTAVTLSAEGKITNPGQHNSITASGLGSVTLNADEEILTGDITAGKTITVGPADNAAGNLLSVKMGDIEAGSKLTVETDSAAGIFESENIKAGSMDLTTNKVKVNGNITTTDSDGATDISGSGGVTVTGNVNVNNNLVVTAADNPVQIDGNVTVNYTVDPQDAQAEKAVHIYNSAAGDNSKIIIGGNIEVTRTGDAAKLNNADAVVLGVNNGTASSSYVTVKGNIVADGTAVISAERAVNVSGSISTVGKDGAASGNVQVSSTAGVVNISDITTNGHAVISADVSDPAVETEIQTGFITAGNTISINASASGAMVGGAAAVNDITINVNDNLILTETVQTAAGTVHITALNGSVEAYKSIISDMEDVVVTAKGNIVIDDTVSADKKLTLTSTAGAVAIARLELADESRIEADQSITVNAIDSQYADEVTMLAKNNNITLYHGLKGNKINLEASQGDVTVVGNIDTSKSASNSINSGSVSVIAKNNVKISGNAVALTDVYLEADNISAANVVGYNTVEIIGRDNVNINNVTGIKGVQISAKEIGTGYVDALNGTILIPGTNGSAVQNLTVNGYMNAGGKDTNGDSIIITTNEDITVIGTITAAGNIKINSLSVDEKGVKSASDIVVFDNIISKDGSVSVTDKFGEINLMNVNAAEDVTLKVDEADVSSRILTEDITGKNITAEAYGLFAAKNITGQTLKINAYGDHKKDAAGLTNISGDINITPVAGFSGDAVAIDAKLFESSGNINVSAANSPGKADIRFNNPGTDAGIVSFMNINNEAGDVKIYVEGYIYGDNVKAEDKVEMTADAGVDTWHITAGEDVSVSSKYGNIDIGKVTSGGDIELVAELKNVITENISAEGNAVIKGYNGVRIETLIGSDGVAVKANDITIETAAKEADFKPYILPPNRDEMNAWLDDNYDIYRKAIDWVAESSNNLTMAQKACAALDTWMKNGLIAADKPVLDPGLPEFFYKYLDFGTLVNSYNADVVIAGEAKASGKVNITSADGIEAGMSIASTGTASDDIILTANDDIIVAESVTTPGNVAITSADGKVYVHSELKAGDSLDIKAKDDVMLNYAQLGKNTSITSANGMIGIAASNSENADSVYLTAPEGIVISDNKGPLNIAAADTSKGKGDIDITTNDVINDLGTGSKNVTDKFDDLTKAQDNLKKVLGTITSAEYQEMEALEKDINDAQAVLADPNATAAEIADAQKKLTSASNTYNAKYGAFAAALNQAIKAVNDAVAALNQAIDGNDATITSGGELYIENNGSGTSQSPASNDIGSAVKPLFVKAAGAESFEAQKGNVYVINKGDMILDHVEGVNVALYTVGSANTPASILSNPAGTGTTPVVKGENVSLIAVNGNIGTASAPLTVDPGKTLTTHGQAVYGSNTKGLPMHEHVLGYGFENHTPTCEGAGNYHGFCPVCAAEYDQVLDPLGHIWDGKLVWSADHTACDLVLTCQRDNSHVKTVPATVTVAVTKQPTFTSKGERVYTATAVFEGKTYTDTYKEEIPARDYYIYNIISGNNTQYDKYTGGGVYLVVDADNSLFEYITIDGVIINNVVHEASGSNTRIFLSEDVLKALSLGAHDIRVQFENGHAIGSISIINTDPNAIPETGDTDNILLWVMIMMAGAALLAGVMRFKKKED